MPSGVFSGVADNDSSLVCFFSCWRWMLTRRKYELFDDYPTTQSHLNTVRLKKPARQVMTVYLLTSLVSTLHPSCCLCISEWIPYPLRCDRPRDK